MQTMTTFETYQAGYAATQSRPVPPVTTTFAFYAEGVELRVRNGGGYGARRRPVLRVGDDLLMQCRQCFVCQLVAAFYRLANPKSVCGRSSECGPCQGRRRKYNHRAERKARVLEALAS